MSQRPQPARGMRDVLPNELKTRRALLDTIVSTYESFGFDQIETPLVEDLHRLVDSEAGENDKLIFKILKRNYDWSQTPATDTDAADLGLRYDLTVPLARYFATNEAQLPSPFKALQVGSVFRAERPQRGRYRQFTQCDIDVFRAEPVITETELVAATHSALTACGMTGFGFRINDRRILDEILTRAHVALEDRSAALISLDKLDKIGEAGVREELDRIAPGMGLAVFEALKAFDIANEPIAADLRSIVDAVSAVTQATMRPDLTLVRGMGYYTGPIFEIEHPELGMSLGGGGRYDAMVQKLSGIDAPACGISIGFERLCLLMEGTVSPARTRVVLLIDKTASASEALAAVMNLRNAGYEVRTERAAKNRRAQLSRLANFGFTHFATNADDVKPLDSEGER